MDQTQLDQSYQKLVKIIETLQIESPNLSQFIIHAQQCIKELTRLPNFYEEQRKEIFDVCETLTGWAGGIMRIAEVTAAHPRALFTAEDELDIDACLEKLGGIQNQLVLSEGRRNLARAANQTPRQQTKHKQLLEQLCDKSGTSELGDFKVYQLKSIHFYFMRTWGLTVPSPENTSERYTKSICLIGEDALVKGVVNLILNFIYGIDYEDDYRLKAPDWFFERPTNIIKLQWQKLFPYPFNVQLIVGTTVENILRYFPRNRKFFQKFLIVDEASNLNETSTREQIETMKRRLHTVSPEAESVCLLVVHKNLNKFIKSESTMKEAGKVSGQVLDLFDPDSIYEKSIEAHEKWTKSHRTLKTLFDNLETQSQTDIPTYNKYGGVLLSFEIVPFNRNKEEYFSLRDRLVRKIGAKILYSSFLNRKLAAQCIFNELEEKEKNEKNRDENYLELLKNCREGFLKYEAREIVRNTSLIEPTQYERDLLKQQQKSVGEVSDTQPQFSPHPELQFKPPAGKVSSHKQLKDASILKRSSGELLWKKSRSSYSRFRLDSDATLLEYD